MYINHLITAKTVVGNQNKDQSSEYLTYVTSSGIVVGKRGKINSFNFEDFDSIGDEISNRMKEGLPVSVIDIASGLFNFTADKKTDEYQSIFLEDVQLLTLQNMIVNLSHYVIFTDQIAGIIPSKIDLNEIQS